MTERERDYNIVMVMGSGAEHLQVRDGDDSGLVQARTVETELNAAALLSIKA